MSIAPITNIPCSLESLNAQEPMAGTAPKAHVWFMLEYTPRWGHKAWEESSIAAEIRQAVDEQLKQIPGARLLLIRQKDRVEGLRFFAAVLSEQPVLYRFQLAGYEDLTELDLVSMVAGSDKYLDNRTDEPLLLVCTNGQRDACCVLHGIAVYNALNSQLGSAVWESSHHGGHRFAANILAFPSGRSYGRLRADNALGIAQAIAEGNVPVEYCRGNTAWAEPAQAAELLLRQQLGMQQEGALRLLDSQPAGESRWRVRFAAENGEHELLVERVEGAPVHASCGDEKMSPSIEYRLID
ncbi:MAG: hypothetical protein KIT70_08095 [Anaerolineales bacterium]|nr:MAG: hypothetical protein KIT70_08095 [Anaerolineales bacterium]